MPSLEVVFGFLAIGVSAAGPLLLADADWLDNFVVVPWANTVSVSTKGSAGASKEIWKVLRFHNFE